MSKPPGGGYAQQRLSDNSYRLSFSANPTSTRETAQTYWLYRASELTLENGYDGFEITSPVVLSQNAPAAGYQKAKYIWIPLPARPAVALPWVVRADIRFIKGPFKPDPPRSFDARELQAALDRFVKSPVRCRFGNVCPHAKPYLKPIEAAPAVESPMPVEPSSATRS